MEKGCKTPRKKYERERERESRVKEGENAVSCRELSRSRDPIERRTFSASFFPAVSIEKIFLHSV